MDILSRCVGLPSLILPSGAFWPYLEILLVVTPGRGWHPAQYRTTELFRIVQNYLAQSVKGIKLDTAVAQL